MSSKTGSDESSPLANNFARILITDVDAVMQRLNNRDSQQVRREFIRTLFAAIEGYIWLYRQQVIDIAKSMEALTTEEEIALSEMDYRVSDKGKIVRQARFLPMLSAFRLTTKIATRLNPHLAIDFDTGDWDRLRGAIAVRNRITHPKHESDLDIGDEDLTLAQGAFFWIIDATVGAMEAATDAFRQHNTEFRGILAGLIDGNPAALAEYRAANAKLD